MRVWQVEALWQVWHRWLLLVLSLAQRCCSHCWEHEAQPIRLSTLAPVLPLHVSVARTRLVQQNGSSQGSRSTRDPPSSPVPQLLLALASQL